MSERWGYIKESIDHSYAKIPTSTIGLDARDHTYSRRTNYIENLQSTKYIADEIGEFNSKNIQYDATKRKIW